MLSRLLERILAPIIDRRILAREAELRKITSIRIEASAGDERIRELVRAGFEKSLEARRARPR